MKRLLTIVLASAAILSASVSASAQYFDHMAIGLGAGLDGVSLQAATPIGNYLQLRAGGSYMYPIKIDASFENLYLGSGYCDVFATGKVDLASFNAMLDVFPGKSTTFRFSFGLFAGNGKLVTADGEVIGKDGQDYAGSFIKVGDYQVGLDQQGKGHAYAGINKFMPYFGIGTGRVYNPEKKFSFSFDFGAMYSGGIRACADGKNIRTGEEVKGIRITSADIENKDGGVIDIFGKIPVLPLLRFAVFYRIF